MWSPFKAMEECARRRMGLQIASNRKDSVNITEHGGEIWICSFGEPVVPLSATKCDPRDIRDFIEQCRDGWESFKRQEQGL